MYINFEVFKTCKFLWKCSKRFLTLRSSAHEMGEDVVVSKCTLPPPIDVSVVRLDIKHGSETRFRLRVGQDIEGRVSMSERAHYQKCKRHKNKSIYVLQRGWIAILLGENDIYEIRIAFARSNERFYVEVPGEEWYSAYLSENVIFSYSSSDNETGDIKDNELNMPSEEKLLSMFAVQESLNEKDISSLIKRSFAF